MSGKFRWLTVGIAVLGLGLSGSELLFARPPGGGGGGRSSGGRSYSGGRGASGRSYSAPSRSYSAPSRSFAAPARTFSNPATNFRSPGTAGNAATGFRNSETGVRSANFRSTPSFAQHEGNWRGWENGRYGGGDFFRGNHFFGPFFYFGYGWPSYYWWPYNFGYGYPYYDYGYTYPYGTNVNYGANEFPAPITDQAAPAQLNVMLPTAEANVLINGKPTTTMGTNRTYETPELTPGSRFSYTITASWQQGGQTVTREMPVTVMAGATSVVDFTRSAADISAPTNASQ